MTFLTSVVPLVVALSLALLVTTVHRRLPPVLASRVVVVTTVVVAGAALPTLWIYGLGYLAHAPFVGRSFEWCSHVVGAHRQVPAWAGIPIVSVGIGGAVRALQAVRSHFRLRETEPGGLAIAGHQAVFAYTLPGPGRRIVVSSGLVDMLDEREHGVVLAHEQAHAAHRHDRYLLVARVAAAAVPLLRPLTARLQFSIERWADEAAVRACGDRRLVARTLGKVALHGTAPAGVAAFTGLGVPARVAALLGPEPGRPRPVVLAAMWALIAATGVLAALQLHHLVAIVTALCPD